MKSISSYADTLEVHRHSYEKDDDFEDFYEDFDFEIWLWNICKFRKYFNISIIIMISKTIIIIGK